MTTKTETLPAIREPNGQTMLLVARTDSWTAVAEQVAILASRIANTELVPAQLRGKDAAVAAVILYGREIGLPPMTALRASYVVNGTVSIKAETMRGLILAAGHDLRFTEATGARCVGVARRAGKEEWSPEVVWTTDMARAAGLLSNPGWQKYPRAMLKARVTAELARDNFADVIGGFSALEEVTDDEIQTAEPQPAAPRRVRRAVVPQPKESYAQPAEPEQAPEPAEQPRTPAGGVPGFPSTYPPQTPSSSSTAPPAAAAAGPTVDEIPLPGEPGYEDVGDEPQPQAEQHEEPQPDDQQDEQPEQSEQPGRDMSKYPITKPQSTKLHATFGGMGITDRPFRLALASKVIGRPLETSSDLTRGEAIALIDTLERIRASEEMSKAMAEVLASPDPLDALQNLT